MKHPHGQTKKPQLLLVWSLLFGVALIAVCSGMQGTLLGLRASLENFGVDTIGLIMSAYYAGFLLGARIVPRWVGRVGHIRVFAALATIASAVILVHSTFIDPLVWFLLRALTGYCLSGLFMVSESWLNTITDNDNRGRLLAAYMFTVTLGFIGGQFLINLA
ncbi:MAG: MFS transporter, partial [Gammaproteobacteria bacterium]|nr:MFS transporter [Gammaproteobacteria bacterium]